MTFKTASSKHTRKNTTLWFSGHVKECHKLHGHFHYTDVFHFYCSHSHFMNNILHPRKIQILVIYFCPALQLSHSEFFQYSVYIRVFHLFYFNVFKDWYKVHLLVNKGLLWYQDARCNDKNSVCSSFTHLC